MKNNNSNQNYVPGIGCYINYEVVCSQNPPESHFKLHFSMIPLPTALDFLCALSARVDNYHGDFELFQKDFLRYLSANDSQVKPLAEKILNRICPGFTFITSEQVAVLIKLAILHCPVIETVVPENFIERILKLMLMYNTFKGRESMKIGSVRESLRAIELRGSFNSHQEDRLIIEVYSNFFEWIKSPEAKSSTNYVDVHEELQQITGLTFEDYAAATLSFICYYVNIRVDVHLPGYTAALRLSDYLKDVTDKKAIEQWFSLNSIALVEARKFFNENTDAFYSGVSLTIFQRTPLLIVEDDIFVCPHLPFLKNKIGHGLFYLLMDGYRKSHGERVANKFTQLFGEFYEAHCYRYASKYFSASSLVFPEQLYGSNVEKRSTDIVVFENLSGIFLEVTNARLSLAQTTIQLDHQVIDLEIQKKIVKKFRQLSNVINDFRCGALKYDNVDPSKIVHIYPIILTLHPIPRVYEINKTIREFAELEGYTNVVDSLSIWDIEDLGLMVDLVRCGFDMSETMCRQKSHQTEYARNMGLKNYIHYFERSLLRRLHELEPIDRLSGWSNEIKSKAISWFRASSETGE